MTKELNSSNLATRLYLSVKTLFVYEYVYNMANGEYLEKVNRG